MIPIFSVLELTSKTWFDKLMKNWLKLYAWVNANKLSLNIDKTNFMLFMPTYSSHCAVHIVINQTRIQEVKGTKFLVVIIDNKLKWSAHINYISKKLPKVLVSYWNQEKFSVMRPCYHCTTHLYILIWVIAYMYGARRIISISMILLYYRTKLCG